MVRILVVVAGVVLMACGLTGCTKSVSGDDVAKQVDKQLAAKVGRHPDSVTCPDDLKAEVGASIRCTLTAGGDKLGVTVKTTAVDGSDVKFSIKVDDHMMKK